MSLPDSSGVAATTLACPMIMSQPLSNNADVQTQDPLVTDIPMQDVDKEAPEPKERKSRSDVWGEFEKTKEGRNVKATCNYCKRSFNGASTRGTTHLRNHLKACVSRPQNRRCQSLLTSIKTGNHSSKIANWKYDALKTRRIIAQMIAKHDYSFNMVEHYYFRELLRSLNPSVKLYSRNTVREDVMKIFEEKKIELQEVFESMSSKVSLTTDLWTAEHQNKGYCCVTCHFIDDDWKLHKKIIAYVMVPPPHSGDALSDVIKSVALTWNIDNKLFAIAVDNASNNDVMIRNLKLWRNGKKILPLDGDLFHMRCSAHILNLIVQDGLSVIADFLKKIRDSITYTRASHSRKLKFENALTHTKLAGKGVSYDVPTRWNSTYIMLKSAIEVRLAFERLVELDSGYKCFPTTTEWKKAEIICGCLKVFYDETLKFSGVKYPTANLYFKGVYEVYKGIINWESSEHVYVREMAMEMRLKYDKYWKTCNLMMSIGMVFDPRYKSFYVEFAFKKIYGRFAQIDIDLFLQSLKTLFSQYELQYASSTNVFNKSSENVLNSSCGESSQVNIDDDCEFDEYVKETIGQEEVPKTELERYLSDKLLPKGNDESMFDVLLWWKTYGFQYPILSRMARDILVVPVSTVASESAFSCGGRVITEYRSSLAAEAVEALSCVKDWLPSFNDHEMVNDSSNVDS